MPRSLKRSAVGSQKLTRRMTWTATTRPQSWPSWRPWLFTARSRVPTSFGRASETLPRGISPTRRNWGMGSSFSPLRANTMAMSKREFTPLWFPWTTRWRRYPMSSTRCSSRVSMWDGWSSADAGPAGRRRRRRAPGASSPSPPISSPAGPVRPPPPDRAQLTAGPERFTAAANWLSGVAFRERLWHWLPLQRRAYRELRELFQLPAGATVLVIRKVAYAYCNKQRRQHLATFRLRGAIPVRKHRYKRDGTVSVYGFRLPFTARPQAELSSRHQAVLCYRRRRHPPPHGGQADRAPRPAPRDGHRRGLRGDVPPP